MSFHFPTQLIMKVLRKCGTVNKVLNGCLPPLVVGQKQCLPPPKFHPPSLPLCRKKSLSRTIQRLKHRGRLDAKVSLDAEGVGFLCCGVQGRDDGICTFQEALHRCFSVSALWISLKPTLHVLWFVAAPQLVCPGGPHAPCGPFPVPAAGSEEAGVIHQSEHPGQSQARAVGGDQEGGGAG